MVNISYNFWWCAEWIERKDNAHTAPRGNVKKVQDLSACLKNVAVLWRFKK